MRDDLAKVHYLIAHTIPDFVNGAVRPVSSLAFLFVVDEAVVQAQPEIITILDYQDQPAEEEIAFLESLLALQSTPWSSTTGTTSWTTTRRSAGRASWTARRASPSTCGRSGADVT